MAGSNLCFVTVYIWSIIPERESDGIHHSLKGCFTQATIHFLLLLSCPEGYHSTSITLMFLSHVVLLFIHTNHPSLLIVCTNNPFFPVICFIYKNVRFKRPKVSFCSFVHLIHEQCMPWRHSVKHLCLHPWVLMRLPTVLESKELLCFIFHNL